MNLKPLKLLLIILSGLTSQSIHAKVDPIVTPIDRARYKAVYNFNFIEDTIRHKIKNTSATLLIGDSVTVYADTHLLTSDSIRFDYALRGQKLNPMALAGASTGCKFTSYHYHGYPEHDVVTVRRTLVDNSCYSEPIPKIYWIETGVIKEIHGLNCKQALCNFRGRDYVAYYSPDIPLSVGPHIFGGLPGLIMELQDSKGEYMWNLILFEPCDYEHIITINLKTPDLPHAIYFGK